MTGSTRIARGAVLTVDEAAAMLRISRQSAYQAVRTGELPTVKIGRRILVPRHRLEQLLGIQEGDGPAGNRAEREDARDGSHDGAYTQ